MAVSDAATLKTYFQTGDQPTQAQFIDLIDSIFRDIATDVSAVAVFTKTFATAAGTDTITANVSAVTALVDGTLVGIRAAGANTSTTPTFAPSGLAAKTIKKFGGQSLAAGDIRAANHEVLLRYNANETFWEMLNPTVSEAAAAVTSVTGTSPIVSSGGTTPAISIADTAVSAGSYTLTTLTVDAKGRLTAASNGAAAAGTAPTIQVFTASGTYTAPANLVAAIVEVQGGGGGAGGSSGAGSAGGSTSFGALLSATGGSGGPTQGGGPKNGGAGGTGSGGDVNLAGGQGAPSSGTMTDMGSMGGSGFFGGAGAGGSVSGNAGAANTGGGGGGAPGGAGAGAGGYARERLLAATIGASQTVTIGAGGATGSGAPAGGAGGSGIVIVTEFY